MLNKTIIDKKSMTDILSKCSERVTEIFWNYGPFKYTDNDWYALGLQKSDLEGKVSETYIGQVRKGTSIKEGRGVNISSEGNLYEGFWKHGKQYGKGRMIYASNALYQGDWKNSQHQGLGIYIDCESGGKRKSEYKKGRAHGEGIEQWPDGTTFIGNYRNGLKNGFGSFKWGDGSSYDGNMNNDLLEGLGTLSMGDGRKYEGYFLK